MRTPKTTPYEVIVKEATSGSKFFGFSRHLTKDNYVVYHLWQIAHDLLWSMDVSFTRENMRHRMYVAESLRVARRQLRKAIAQHGQGKEHGQTRT